MTGDQQGQNRAGHYLQLFLFTSLLSTAASLLVFSGCQNERPKHSDAAPAIQHSSIVVQADADRVRVKTASAEFVLSPSGYLSGGMTVQDRSATLDEPGDESGQLLTIGHKRIEDIVFDLKNAHITDAQGKLGR